jgi:hypothetical protein
VHNTLVVVVVETPPATNKHNRGGSRRTRLTIIKGTVDVSKMPWRRPPQLRSSNDQPEGLLASSASSSAVAAANSSHSTIPSYYTASFELTCNSCHNNTAFVAANYQPLLGALRIMGGSGFVTQGLTHVRAGVGPVHVLTTPPQIGNDYIPFFYYHAFCYDNKVPGGIRKLSPGLETNMSPSIFFVDQANNTCLNNATVDKVKFPAGQSSSSLNIRLNCGRPTMNPGPANVAKSISHYSFSLRSICQMCHKVNAVVRYKPITMGASSARDDDWAVAGWFDNITSTATLLLSTQHPVIFLYAFCENNTTRNSSSGVQQVVRVEWSGEFSAVLAEPKNCWKHLKPLRLDLSSSKNGQFTGVLDCGSNSTVAGE